jgi:hypothetical protein
MAQAQVVLALDSGALILAEKDQRVEAIVRGILAESLLERTAVNADATASNQTQETVAATASPSA